MPRRLAPVKSENTFQEEMPLNEMLANLIKFLLLMHPAKELTSQVEMLKKVLRDYQEHFPVVFSQASQCLQLVCGVEVKEMEPREHIYIMVPTVGLTYDKMLNSGQGLLGKLVYSIFGFLFSMMTWRFICFP
ncbi:hypothetical protein JEQ12_020164 [Ovis aries]|uniref:MAGE domain-containing protein n=1 Tax=Ovis aries TaxID=9940 RepID=A0A835ZR91_SHEEP|nr:hypothetical protein JEQ12_020164 [Ovis aries]